MDIVHEFINKVQTGPATPLLILHNHHDADHIIPELEFKHRSEKSDDTTSPDDADAPGMPDDDADEHIDITNDQPAERGEPGFWRIIERFEWRNASDGPQNGQNILDIIGSLSQKTRRDFARVYKKCTGDMMDHIIDQELMFDDTPRDVVIAAATHAVGLGQMQYYTLLNDPVIFQYLIDNDEFVSLNEYLPDDIRV